MSQPGAGPDGAAGLRVLHLALGTGLALVGIVLVGVQSLTGGPPLAETPFAGHILGAIGLLAALAGGLVLRRRLPLSRAGQSPLAYWSAGETRGGALRAWVVTEGGGVLAGVGGYLTASPLGVAGFVAALVLLAWMAAGRLSGS